MKKAVLFNEFASHCPYRSQNIKPNGSYGCNNPGSMRENELELDDCACNMCLFGIAAEQEDLDNPEYSQNIEWNGLCKDGKLIKDILLLNYRDDTPKDINPIKDTNCNKQEEKHRHNALIKIWLKVPFCVRYRLSLMKGATMRFINHIKHICGK